MNHRYFLLSLAATFAAAAAPAAAMDVQHLSGDVSVLTGSSCNVLILPGEGGVLIIDDQRLSNFAETLAGVRSVSDKPVRYVIDTHWHLDHSGGNGSFASAGAAIIAQRNVLARRSTDQFMVAYNAHIPAAPEADRPVITYDDDMNLRIGSETVELHHVPAAHTDGDTLVKFKNADVIAMGDVFFSHIWPFIDRSSGGSIQGMIKGVDAALAMADERTRIVPAHGDVATVGELRVYRGMLQAVAQRVRSQVSAGRSEAEVVASHPAAAYRTGMEGEEDRFVEAVYDSFRHANLHHRL